MCFVDCQYAPDEGEFEGKKQIKATYGRAIYIGTYRQNGIGRNSYIIQGEFEVKIDEDGYNLTPIGKFKMYKNGEMIYDRYAWKGELWSRYKVDLIVRYNNIYRQEYHYAYTKKS